MIELEPFTKDNFQRFISWIRDKESLVEFAGTYFEFPVTIDQLEKYLSEQDRSVFRVRESRSAKIMGHAEIFQIEENRVRLCRVLIGEKAFRGKGLGQEIVKHLLKCAFRSVKVEAVELNVYEQNMQAKRCYEKVGFQRNVQGDRMTRIDGQDWKSLNMVMMREEWSRNPNYNKP